MQFPNTAPRHPQDSFFLFHVTRHSDLVELSLKVNLLSSSRQDLFGQTCSQLRQDLFGQTCSQLRPALARHANIFFIGGTHFLSLVHCRCFFCNGLCTHTKYVCCLVCCPMQHKTLATHGYKHQWQKRAIDTV